jgi:hypothetical protein
VVQDLAHGGSDSEKKEEKKSPKITLVANIYKKREENIAKTRKQQPQTVHFK